jgi:hypothetical protein
MSKKPVRAPSTTIAESEVPFMYQPLRVLACTVPVSTVR